ncbi:MAG: GYD domain-containing protein [Chloroflexi bacterium]|jgi:uncharacterized protein with GYD domain|nr:GYD domain-containing protein [Chloroflexota bacterium]
MTVYMTQFSYTAEAFAALAKNPEDRSAPVKALVESLGGRFIGMWYSFGDYDGVILTEAPDNGTAATAVIAATLGGHIKDIKTTVLLTIDEAMSATGRAGNIVYRAPEG